MRERVKLRVPWWGQAAAEKQMRITLEDIYSAAREQRQWESGRRGEGEKKVEGEVMDSYG